MARSMVLGNGNILVCLDKFGQARDFYFPYAGQENHIGPNQVHKIGVFVDGRMHWIDNGAWQITISYSDRSMLCHMRAVNHSAKIELESFDVVYNEKNIFLRKYILKNLDSHARELKLFQNHQFKIGDTNHADTAYFSSTIESIIHYKGRRVFLCGGLCENRPFDDYGIGFCGIEGKEGTWRDAEDGVLSKNSIEHGIVDSVVGWGRQVSGGSTMVVYSWTAVGETYREVVELLNYIFEKTPEHLLETTADFWHAWLGQVDVGFPSFSDKAKDLFYSSLLVMRTHTDNRGGILASADSGNVQYGGDTYVYVWPRDAAFVALSYDLAGFHDLARHFYRFANEVLTEEGYVLHKYQPDRSLGSSWHPWVKDGKRQLAIQEDETAILLFCLWEHYIRAKDLEFIEGIYNSFIKKAAEFLIRYRDIHTGLPLPSYDLWEERYGVSTFTTSIVYAGLIAAYNFARTLGKEDEAARFHSEAAAVRKALSDYLWDSNKNYFGRLVQQGDTLEKDGVVDVSSFYGAFRFGVFAPDDPRMTQAYRVASSELSVSGPVGGIARYQGDNYARVAPNTPGNPWFVTSLWLTQYRIAAARSLQELEVLRKDIEWAASFARSGMLSEQIHPETGEGVSATPLVWSHAEYVRTVLEYEKKYRVLNLKSGTQ